MLTTEHHPKLQYLDLRQYTSDRSAPWRYHASLSTKAVPPTRQKSQKSVGGNFWGQCSIIFEPCLQIAQNYRIDIASHTKGNALYGSIMVSKANPQEIVKYCSRGPLSSFLDMQRDHFRPRRRIPFKLPHQAPPRDQIQRVIWLDPGLGLK